MADDEKFSVSWKEYVDSQLASLEKATLKSKEVIDGRLEAMNELRKVVEQVQSMMIPREEFGVLWRVTEARVTELTASFSNMRESAAELKGKASMGQVYLVGLGVIVSIVTSIAGVIIAVLK